MFNVVLSFALSMQLLLPPDTATTDQKSSFLKADIASDYAWGKLSGS